MTTPDALRVIALAAQAEMALVRRDDVAGPLLAQAARAAEGTSAAQVLDEAATLVRVAPEREAVRQAALSLCRMGLHEAEAVALAAGT
jgi:hypothetical protein